LPLWTHVSYPVKFALNVSQMQINHNKQKCFSDATAYFLLQCMMKPYVCFTSYGNYN
jgi:hypothetical protein